MVYRNSRCVSGVAFTALLLSATTSLVHAAVNGEQQWISTAIPVLNEWAVVDQRMSASGQFIVYTRESSAGAGQGGGYVWNRSRNLTTRVADAVSDFSQADVDNAGNVVFVTANALDVDDDNTVADVYHTVPGSGIFTLLSRLPGGGEVGNGASTHPRISTNGQYVVFESTAANFSGFNDANGAQSDVYRVNVSTGAVDLVSRAAGILTPPQVPLAVVDGLTGNGASRAGDISADGRYVAYQSMATDLNQRMDANGSEFDVVVRDMQGSNASEFVAFFDDPLSTATDTQSTAASVSAGISESGDTVVFKTEAALDVVNDTNDQWDVYTSTNGIVTLHSIDDNGVALGGDYGDRLEAPTSMGPVVWSTSVAQTGDDENTVSDVYFSQADAITAGEDVLVEIASAADSTKTSGAASLPATQPAVSGDGRYVSYITANAAQASMQSDTNGAADVYVFDRGAGYCDNFLAINQFTIDSGKWYQLTLPCEPPAGSVVADILGDDLPGMPFDPTPGVDNSAVVWAAYTYNPITGLYEALALDAPLSAGIGFWVRQDSGAPLTLDLPENSWQRATTTKFNQACVDVFHGCASLMLTGANTVATQLQPRWNLVGNPLGGEQSRNLNNARVVITSDSGMAPCEGSTVEGSAAAGCTLNEALNLDVLVPIFFHWNPDTETYETLGRDDTIDFGPLSSRLSSWQGIWVGELNAASAQQIQLLIPEDEEEQPLPPVISGSVMRQ